MPKPKQRICLKCDDGKGHKMIEIWSYKVNGDYDKLKYLSNKIYVIL